MIACRADETCGRFYGGESGEVRVEATPVEDVIAQQSSTVGVCEIAVATLQLAGGVVVAFVEPFEVAFYHAGRMVRDDAAFADVDTVLVAEEVAPGSAGTVAEAHGWFREGIIMEGFSALVLFQKFSL